MTINIDPRWQLSGPSQERFETDGSFELRAPVGRITLPQDYRDFIVKHEGGAFRDKGGCFIARFKDGTRIFEMEWLGTLRNLRLATRRYRRADDGENRAVLPPGYAFIGYCEPGPTDALLCYDQNTSDYGKVFVWIHAEDPWMEGDNVEGIGHVADSFTEFMNNLTDRDVL